MLQKSSKPKEIQINSSSLSGEDHNSPLQLKEKINLKISFRLMWRILQRRQREIKKTFKQFMITFALLFMFIFMMVMLIIIMQKWGYWMKWQMDEFMYNWLYECFNLNFILCINVSVWLMDTLVWVFDFLILFYINVLYLLTIGIY